MTSLLTPEGTLALAIGVLELVLGWRFTLPDRGRDVAGFCVFALAVILGFLTGRGYVPASPALISPTSVRIAGGVVLLAGLMLAGRSARARMEAGQGRLVTGGPYARIRHPLYLGLSLVLVGGCLRSPSTLGWIPAALAVAGYVWLGVDDERAAAGAFGEAWRDYARRTPAVVPLRGLRRAGRGVE